MVQPLTVSMVSSVSVGCSLLAALASALLRLAECLLPGGCVSRPTCARYDPRHGKHIRKVVAPPLAHGRGVVATLPTLDPIVHSGAWRSCWQFVAPFRAACRSAVGGTPDAWHGATPARRFAVRRPHYRAAALVVDRSRSTATASSHTSQRTTGKRARPATLSTATTTPDTARGRGSHPPRAQHQATRPAVSIPGSSRVANISASDIRSRSGSRGRGIPARSTTTAIEPPIIPARTTKIP